MITLTSLIMQADYLLTMFVWFLNGTKGRSSKEC